MNSGSVRDQLQTLKRGLPGHAFVSFSSKNATGERDFLAVGRTIPKGSEATAAWSYFTGEPIAGFLGQERYSSGMQECLLVKVNKGPYEVARSLTEGPAEGAWSTGPSRHSCAAAGLHAWISRLYRLRH
jgi:hypothetical protein